MKSTSIRSRSATAACAAALAACGGGAVALLAYVAPIGGSWRLDGNADVRLNPDGDTTVLLFDPVFSAPATLLLALLLRALRARRLGRWDLIVHVLEGNTWLGRRRCLDRLGRGCCLVAERAHSARLLLVVVVLEIHLFPRGHRLALVARR